MTMNRWPEVKLKELCNAVTVGFVGSMADEYCDEGVPFLRSQNITPFQLNLRDIKYIPQTFHERIRKSTLRPGDVGIVRTGYPGTACVIPDDLPESNCSDLVILRPGKELNPHFIAALFNSTFGKTLVGGNLVGAAQQHFNVTVAKELKLRIPTRVEQDKIAAVMVGINDLLANNQRRIALLESMAEEIYREWFVRMRFPGWANSPTDKGIPANWSRKTIDSLLAESKRPIKKADLSTVDRYVGLEHIPRKTAVLDAWGQPDSVDSDKLRFSEGDILFGKIRPYLHKIAISSFSGACSTDTIVLKPRQADFLLFAYFTVSSNTFVDLATVASKGTKMPRADWQFLKQVEITTPPECLLQSFNAVAKPLIEAVV